MSARGVVVHLVVLTCAHTLSEHLKDYKANEIVECANFRTLYKAYEMSKNISIYGPKGVGKSTSLLWLLQKERDKGNVIYCDLLCDLLEDVDATGKILLVDNAQRSIIGDRAVAARASFVIAAFSPLNYLRSLHSNILTRTSTEIYFVPFTEEEALSFIEKQYADIEKDVQKFIVSLCCGILLYLDT